MLNGTPRTVVGVMPSTFPTPRWKADLWVPTPITRDPRFGRGRSLSVVARLKPGVTLAQANEDLHAVAAQYGRERPAMNEGWSAQAFPMLEDAVQGVRLPLLVLLAAVGLVLLIACANVANLMLMRGASRLREISVRAALGAGKGRLLQQLLFESLALAAVACAAGLVAGYFGLKALLAALPEGQLPRHRDRDPNGRHGRAVRHRSHRADRGDRRDRALFPGLPGRSSPGLATRNRPNHVAERRASRPGRGGGRDVSRAAGRRGIDAAELSSPDLGRPRIPDCPPADNGHGRLADQVSRARSKDGLLLPAVCRDSRRSRAYRRSGRRTSCLSRSEFRARASTALESRRRTSGRPAPAISTSAPDIFRRWACLSSRAGTSTPATASARRARSSSTRSSCGSTLRGATRSGRNCSSAGVSRIRWRSWAWSATRARPSFRPRRNRSSSSTTSRRLSALPTSWSARQPIPCRWPAPSKPPSTASMPSRPFRTCSPWMWCCPIPLRSRASRSVCSRCLPRSLPPSRWSACMA